MQQDATHLRGEAAQVGVLHKAAGLGAEVVLGEVRQGAPLEAEGYPLALYVLLPHARNHLRSSTMVLAVRCCVNQLQCICLYTYYPTLQMVTAVTAQDSAMLMSSHVGPE